MQAEHDNHNQDKLVEETSHISNKTMGITNIDEPTKEDAHVWHKVQDIRRYPVEKVAVAKLSNVLSISVVVEEMFISNLKKGTDVGAAEHGK